MTFVYCTTLYFAATQVKGSLDGIPVMLVGNKSDEESGKRDVNQKTGEALQVRVRAISNEILPPFVNRGRLFRWIFFLKISQRRTVNVEMQDKKNQWCYVHNLFMIVQQPCFMPYYFSKCGSANTSKPRPRMVQT